MTTKFRLLFYQMVLEFIWDVRGQLGVIASPQRLRTLKAFSEELKALASEAAD